MIINNIDNVKPIEINSYDYYRPYYAEDSGWEFNYIAKDNKTYLFSLPAYYLLYILKLLYYLNLSDESQILEKFSDGGGMFIDEKIFDKPWPIKDKKLLIDNLKNVTRKNLDYVFSNISEHDLVVEIADDIINVASNLISYIKDSEGYELKLNYI